MSKIEWTDATWNPVAGCSVVSPGCKHCYAMTMAGRLARMGQEKYAGLTQRSKAGDVWTGRLTLDEAALLAPLRWKRPRRIFVNSMSDLGHDRMPDQWIDRVFAVMALCPQHTFQVLTKRADRMRKWFEAAGLMRDGCVEIARADRVEEIAQEMSGNSAFRLPSWPLPNVWLGVSVEDQARADERVPDLLATPAAVRFLSCEPLLGPVNLRRVDVPDYGFLDALTPGYFVDRRPPRRGIDWVIVGGESGPGARPMHPDWARSLRDQCATAGVPFLFKQWGEFREFDTGPPPHVTVDDESDTADAMFAAAINPSFITEDGRHILRRRDLPQDETPCRLIERVGKKAAGRLLDGVLHDAYPARPAP